MCGDGAQDLREFLGANKDKLKYKMANCTPIERGEVTSSLGHGSAGQVNCARHPGNVGFNYLVGLLLFVSSRALATIIQVAVFKRA
jgi:hypothetical protein